ncbi:MAG: hypothetical protein EPN50_06745 [Chloroflexota bacterium]|nr:MAG: hypothetical protein EPN50_06745 [Chloroflexota bacterium]
MQRNVVVMRGARLRASFPHPTARDRERSLGLRRPAFIRAPRRSAGSGPAARPRALVAELRARSASPVRPQPSVGTGIRRTGQVTWSTATPRRIRGLAGSPWPG